jgi:hypothetical protein
MLQNIHQPAASSRASSIYCRWVRESSREGAHLIAVWIDSEMRCFERECTPASQPEVPQDALDEPGGLAFLRFADALHS